MIYKDSTYSGHPNSDAEGEFPGCATLTPLSKPCCSRDLLQALINGGAYDWWEGLTLTTVTLQRAQSQTAAPFCI
eukprot:1137203-Pelagomonas_calceolata.AAC.5